MTLTLALAPRAHTLPSLDRWRTLVLLVESFGSEACYAGIHLLYGMFGRPATWRLLQPQVLYAYCFMIKPIALPVSCPRGATPRLLTQ